MCENKWIKKRAELREHLKDEEKRGWSHAALARLIGMSDDFVAKWRPIVIDTDLDDFEVLQSRSRARITSPKRVTEAVEAKILYYRETLTEKRNTIVGARGIKPFLLKDSDLKQLGVYIPTSTSTITGVLNDYGRIFKPAPRIHIPAQRPPAMQVWEMDFTDITSATSERTEKKQHQVESLNIIDVGSSLAIATEVSDHYDAEEALFRLIDILYRTGCPGMIRMDRDPRYIGNWKMDEFPSAMIRFLCCVGIKPDICPPNQPWKKGFIERYNRTQKQEAIRKHHPATVEDAQMIVENHRYEYNVERPNQAITCQDRPPAEAIGDVPMLPRLPDEVDPDSWVSYWDGQVFRRTVPSNGSVSVDNFRYYIGRQYKGQRVLLKIDADEKLFVAYRKDKELKKVPIKGLAHGLMPFEDYLPYITQQARSEQKRDLYKRRMKQRKIR